MPDDRPIGQPLRPLFDPAKMAARAVPDVDRPWSVAQLAAAIASTLMRHMPAKVRVAGEISNFTERTHWYFAIKDDAAVVNAVMFASASRKMRFTPKSGQQVLVTGRVEFYEKLGRVTLMVESIEPVGAGALELALRALVEEIRALGWIDPARKRAIPSFPRRVAVVTSRAGAALQDVLDTARRRCPAVEWLIVDVRVQGDGSAGEITAALRMLGERAVELAIDAILLTRGGGSIEDLWSFNDKEVARAIVESPVPVIAAIGHETDTTIAELVADLRAATPTQAAMRLTPDRVALLEQLETARKRLTRAIERRVDLRRQLESSTRSLTQAAAAGVRYRAMQIERLSARLERHRPVSVLERRAARIDELRRRLDRIGATLARRDLSTISERLRAALRRRLDAERAGLDERARELHIVGPPSVLNRGYSYTRRADGTLVRSTADVSPGTSLRTRVTDGEISSTVGGSEGQRRLGTPAVIPARRRRPSPPTGPGLFDATT